MKTNALRQRGFTQRETAVPLLIIAILAAIAVESFQKAAERTRAADIVDRYDALRKDTMARVAQPVDDCGALAANLDQTRLASPNANLRYGFVPVAGGYRPVLHVCARAETSGEPGVKAARGAHDKLAAAGAVEKGAMLTESAVGFSLRLTGNDKASCKMAPAIASPNPCAAR